MPAGHDADRLRKIDPRSSSTCRSAPGLTKLGGKVFRIGHLGDFNDLTLMGTLAGVEMGLGLAGVPAQEGRRAGRDGVPRDAPRPRRLAKSPNQQWPVPSPG